MRYTPFRALVLGALLLASLRVFAAVETLTISRQVVLPDGKPAAGARVVIRTMDSDSTLLQELQTTTGPDGMIRAAVRYRQPEMPFSPFGPVSNGYLMVDLPGYALAFGKLFGDRAGGRAVRPGSMAPPPVMVPGGFRPGAPPPGAGGQPAGGGSPLQLSPAYQQTGTVVDGATKQPVAGATVFPVALVKSVPVNFFWAGFMTKELVATSGADGQFTLRGVTAESIGGMGMPYMAGTVPAGLVAYATVGENTLVGENDRFVYSPQPRGGPLEIALQPTVTLEGRVMNGLTNKPVANVQVHLEGTSTWINCLPGVSTDTDGNYRFSAVLSGPRIYAVSKGANYTVGFVLATRGRGREGEKIAAPAITVRPMGPPVTLKVLDGATGRPPASVLQLAVNIAEGMFDDNLGWIGRQVITMPVKPDGTASATMPVGDTSVNVWGPGYQGGKTVEVPAANNEAIITLNRSQGLLIRFTTQHPQGLIGCFVTVKDGNGNNIQTTDISIKNPEGYWFCPLRDAPPGPYQVQVMRSRTPVCEWTTVSPNTWPNAVAIR